MSIALVITDSAPSTRVSATKLARPVVMSTVKIFPTKSSMNILPSGPISIA